MIQADINAAIARVIRRVLRNRAATTNEGLQFYFQDIRSECVAEAVNLIRNDAQLGPITEIHVARNVFSGNGLPDSLLTDRAVGDFRNGEFEPGRRLMLLGPPDSREWETLRFIKPFGETQIMDAVDEWVCEFATNIVDAQNRAWWAKALEGLNVLQFAELDQFAAFVLRTAEALNSGIPLTEALGQSLPALRLSRFLALFAIQDRERGHKSQWQRKFSDHKKRTQCYLSKKDKSEAFLEKDALEKAFEEYKASSECDESLLALFQEYIDADYGWTETSARIAEIDWPILNAALIEPVARKRTRNLGADTQRLFEEDNKLPDLTDDQKDYLSELSASRTRSEPNDDDRKFFKAYYRQLQASPAVFSRWEAFIMEKSIEADDFLLGLARCLKALRPRGSSTPWKLVVTAKAQTKDLLQVNEVAATYFATLYRGLQSVLGTAVDFRTFSELMNYPELLNEWKQDPSKAKKLKGARPSKLSCQITFYVNLSTDKERKVKLVWRFNPKCVAANLRSDIERLVKAPCPMACTEVVRETSGRRPVPLDLSDTKSLQPAFGKIAGTLIPQADNLKEFLVGRKFNRTLDELEHNRHLTADQGMRLRDSFADLEAKYKAALDAFLVKGIVADSEIEAAVDSYGVMLEAAASSLLPDLVQGAILPILLSISTVDVLSYGPESQPTAIVPPWHPLRLLAMVTKAKQFGELVAKICLSKHSLSDADGDLLFEDLHEWLSHVYYPEVVCRLQGSQPKLLAVCDHYADYSIHVPPVKEPGSVSSDDSDPKSAAKHIARIVDYYLSLQPHERDNLSIVLFDCDSELLPEAVVDEIRKMNEDEEQDVTCQILLTHSDRGKLRALYRTLSRRNDSPDTFNSSEATRDFMSRLRINIMVAENGAESSKGGQPYDIVFADNTIARRARLKWEEIDVDAANAGSVKPSSWSRRRPMRSGAITSAVYLTTPRAPSAVWRYLRAIGHACEPDQVRSVAREKCLVPCRTLGIHDEEIGALIDRMHNLGSWVVNHDELLHRNLVSQQGIRIIRFKQESTQGKNLIVSSKAKVEMLRNELCRLATTFIADLDNNKLNELTTRLITEANCISGNLVLRAVRRRENAKELFGLVLSKHIVTAVLKGNRRLGWFLLDDYAHWLGEDDKQIADLFCLSPAYDENNLPTLDIVITEAKFVEHALREQKAKESAAQLKQSLSRIEAGLNPETHSLDREIWLARISDMIVDGMEMFGSDGFDAAEWRRKVRDGGCAISIRGFSHVFDSGPEIGIDEVLSTSICDTRNGVQEVHSLAATKRILSAFVKGQEVLRPVSRSESDAAGRRMVVPEDQPVAGLFSDSSSRRKDSGGEPTSHSDAPSSSEPSVAYSSVESEMATGASRGGIVNALGSPPLEAIDGDDISQWADRTTVDCRRALLGYSMHAEVVAPPILTPNSLLLKFRGTDRLTRDALERKSEELRTTHAIDVIGIRPDLGTVTVVISRPKRQRIFISEIWRRWQPSAAPKGNNRIVVAVKEDDNQLLHLSPVPLPHTLVAGMTGSGKSVLLQNIILGIAATNTPELAQIAIIDPKCSAQLKPFNKLPHLIGQIVDDQQSSLALLESLITTMENRNKILSDADASDIDEYIESGHRDMSRIWVIYDEYGDWIRDSDDYRKQCWALLDRLAMKARSSGIYLVLAAQRPDNTLFSMVMRSNLGNRLALLVADQGTSDVATGVKGLGADRLLGGGHLLAKTGDVKEPVYAQVPFVSSDEVKKAVKYLSESYGRSSQETV